MISVAFFVENSSIGDVDFSDVSQGNPGVGGSEYMIILISWALSMRDNGIEVTLFSQKLGNFPNSLNCVVLDNLDCVIAECSRRRIDYLVFKHNPCYINDGTLDVASNVPLIAWCHNFVASKDLSYYARNSNVKRILCVGAEQRELYRDHEAFLKSDYIYNCIGESQQTFEDARCYPFNQRPNNVTYVGSIVPNKGLHLLAKAWPSVLREIPDATLSIIGSGKLYGRNAQLGEWGIADQNYERMIMPYLGNGGDILPSVKFLGILGAEKRDVLLHTKVGVPNPSGFSETFGISAVEMQAMGAKIATMRCAGYLDTVRNGILYDNPEYLAEAIVKLLKTDRNEFDEVVQYINDNFTQDVVCRQWEKFLCDALLNDEIMQAPTYGNLSFELKFLKVLLWRAKTFLPILYRVIPNIDRVMTVWDNVFRKGYSRPHKK